MTMMPPKNVLNKLQSKASLEKTGEHKMILWVKAATPASTQLAIDFIGILPGVEHVHLATPKPIMFKAMLRIEYCLQQTCAAQIAQEAAQQGLVTRQVGVIRFKCS